MADKSSALQKTKRIPIESKIESAFCKAVTEAGGMALKFTSQTMNGIPDRLVLFRIGKCAFVELKAPGKQMRPLQRKRRHQLEALGFPVFCVDSFDQIQPVIEALRNWKTGQPFPKGVGAVIPEIEEMELPGESEPRTEEMGLPGEVESRKEEVMPL